MRLISRAASVLLASLLLAACSGSDNPQATDDAGKPSDRIAVHTDVDAGHDTAADAGACPTGQSFCGDECVDESSDLANCGACGNACKSGEVCSDGECELSCSGGTTLCDGLCKDTQVDPNNCGACGEPCKSGEVCSAGKCALSCGSPLTLCDSGTPVPGTDGLGAAAPYCANTDTDRLNCGACGVACDPGMICVAGACATSCGEGLVDCGDGTCRDLSTDDTKCGASCATAVACESGLVCSEGVCATICTGGTVSCGDGRCRDLSYDPTNCGACGNSCGEGMACVAGACTPLGTGTE